MSDLQLPRHISTLPIPLIKSAMSLAWPLIDGLPVSFSSLLPLEAAILFT